MIVNYREVKIAKKNSRILPINSSKIYIYIYLKEEEDKLVFVSPNVQLLIGYLTCKITILTYARR